MAGSVVMFGSVFVGRRITTMRFATGLAGTQVHPRTSYGYTFVALVHSSFLYFLVLRQVNTGFGIDSHEALKIKLCIISIKGFC